MKIRNLTENDVAEGRLTNLFELELDRVPDGIETDLERFEEFAQITIQNLSNPDQVCFVVDDGSSDLVGIYCGYVMTMPFYRTRILFDAFYAVSAPGVMNAIVKEVVRRAASNNCAGCTLSSSSATPSIVERWGRKFGFSPLTLTLYRRL